MSLLFLAGCSKSAEFYDHAFLYNPTLVDFNVEIQRLRTVDLDCDLLRAAPENLLALDVVDSFSQIVPSKEVIGLSVGVELPYSRDCFAYIVSVEGVGQHHLVVGDRRRSGPRKPSSIVSLAQNTVIVRPDDEDPWSDGGAGILYDVDPSPICEPTERFGWEIEETSGFIYWGQPLADGCFVLLDLYDVEVGHVCAAGHEPFETWDVLQVVESTSSIELVRSDGVGLALSYGEMYSRPSFRVVEEEPMLNSCVYESEECLNYVERSMTLRLAGHARLLESGDQTTWYEDGTRWTLFVIRSSSAVNLACRSGDQVVVVSSRL